MRRGFLLLILFVTGCSREASYRAVVEEQIAAWDEMGRLFETVKDKDSMAAAQDRLHALEKRYRAIAERAKSLATPNPDIQEKLRDEIERLQTSLLRVRREMNRIRELPGGKEFLAGLEGLEPR